MVVHWDDVTLPENLKTKGEAWLRDNQYETMTLELNAVDLSVLSSNLIPLSWATVYMPLAAPFYGWTGISCRNWISAQEPDQEHPCAGQ